MMRSTLYDINIVTDVIDESLITRTIAYIRSMTNGDYRYNKRE